MNQVLFSRTNIGLIAALGLVTVAGAVLIPHGTLLPIHWGLSGQPDGFLPRDGALLVAPAAVVFTLLVVWAVGRFAPAEQVEAGRHAWRTVVPSLSGLFLVVQGSIIMIGLGYPDVMVRVLCIALGVMLVLMGNVLPKTQPNGLAGIRLPWLRDLTTWRKTHRLGGMLFVAGGVLLCSAAVFLSEPVQLMAVLVIAIVIPLVATTIYSYRMTRRT